MPFFDEKHECKVKKEELKNEVLSMKSLSIITQNMGASKSMFGKSQKQRSNRDYLTGALEKKDSTQEYMERYDADIYVFQDLSKIGGRNKNFRGFQTRPEADMKYGGKETDMAARALWQEAFPWIEYKVGCWMEKTISFDEEEIVIINYHCTSGCAVQSRYILLKRLEQEDLKGKCVLLTGEFNPMYHYQTEQVIKENWDFLQEIVRREYVDVFEKETEKEARAKLANRCWQMRNNWNAKREVYVFASRAFIEKVENGQWLFETAAIGLTEDIDSETDSRIAENPGVKIVITVSDNSSVCQKLEKEKNVCDNM